MSATPEQVIGNAFALVTRLKRLGVSVHNRPQAIGSAIVGTLRNDGYEVVERSEIESLRRWKGEALTVLSEWEQVWQALGCPGFLGESKAAASLRHLGAKNGSEAQA
jgi:hypothetical protein